MADGFNVEPEELRSHANNLEAIKQCLDAVMDARTFIEQDDEAEIEARIEELQRQNSDVDIRLEWS